MNQNLSTNTDDALRIREALENLTNASKHYESAERTLRTHNETFYLRPTTRSNTEAAELYSKAAQDEQEVEQTIRVFDYRPWDGAYAVDRKSVV